MVKKAEYLLLSSLRRFYDSVFELPLWPLELPGALGVARVWFRPQLKVIVPVDY